MDVHQHASGLPISKELGYWSTISLATIFSDDNQSLSDGNKFVVEYNKFGPSLDTRLLKHFYSRITCR